MAARQPSSLLRLALVLSSAAALSAPAGNAVTLRFTNLPEGVADVTTTVERRQNLLNVADGVGVRVPRACRNGLCGTCECTLTAADGTVSVVRACSTDVEARHLAGSEIVVAVGAPGGSGDKAKDLAEREASMARFSEDWENEYVPDFHAQGGQPSHLRDFSDGGDEPAYGGAAYGSDDGWRKAAAARSGDAARRREVADEDAWKGRAPVADDAPPDPSSLAPWETIY